MLRTILRFIVAAIVLLVTAAIVPGFRIGNFLSALLAAVIISAIGWVLENVTNNRYSPFAKGLTGFIVSVLVLYLVQFFVPGFRVTLFGAIIASLLISLIDMILPTTRRKLTT